MGTTTDDILARERARSEAMHRELEEIGEQLAPIADMGKARHLALAIVTELILWFAHRSLGPVYDAALAELQELLAVARAAMTVPRDVPAVCIRADRLASRFFSRCGPNGTWPIDLQIPWHLANMLRRSCEAEVWRFVPLVVSDGRWLLERAVGDAKAVDDLVASAVREATEDVAA